MQGFKHNKVRRSQNKAGKTTLRIMFANVRGITGKVNSVNGIVKMLKPQVFGFVETLKNVDSN